jgi:hypothetical protein
MSSALLNVIAAVGQFFRWLAGRSEIRNAPDVKAAKVAQQEQDERAKDAEAVAKGDVEEVRRRCSE